VITLHIEWGNDIYDAALCAIRIARETGEVVQFQFNDRRVRVTNADTIPGVERRYVGAHCYRKPNPRSEAWWMRLRVQKRRLMIQALKNDPATSFPRLHP